jgi:hypothetical protein
MPECVHASGPDKKYCYSSIALLVSPAAIAVVQKTTGLVVSSSWFQKLFARVRSPGDGRSKGDVRTRRTGRLLWTSPRCGASAKYEKNIQLVAENTALKFVRRKGEGARESKRILPSMSRGLA